MSFTRVFFERPSSVLPRGGSALVSWQLEPRALSKLARGLHTALVLGCSMGACSFDVVDFASRDAVEVIVIGDVPQASIDELANSPASKADPKQLALDEPADGAIIPSNLAPLQISWNGMAPMMPMDARVYELRMTGAGHELRIYTSAQDAVPPAENWRALLSPGAHVTLELRTLMPGPKAKVVVAEAHSFDVRAAPPTGTLLYEAQTGVRTATLDSATNAPWMSAAGVTCTQGLAVSADGARAGIACSGGTGAIWNLHDGSVVRMLDPDPDVAAFGAFEPSGARYVRERAGQLELVDVVTGVVQQTLVTGGHEPDWSPSGSEIAFAYDGMMGMSGLARVLLDATRSTWSAPQLLVAGASVSAPRYAPDGSWLAYQGAMGPMMDAGKVALIATDDAAMPISIMGSASAPTWVPGTDARTAWLVFSLDRAMPSVAQLWLAAIDLGMPKVHPPVRLPFQDPSVRNQRALFAP